MNIAPHHRIYTCFFLFAVSLGALLARMPDLQVALGVNKSELGLTLIGMAVGALISLTLSSPLIAHLGARTTAFVTVLGTAAAFALVPWVGAAPLVFAILFCAGLLAGALEINLNVEIDRIEAQLGRGVMNRAHGFWSLGFFVTALIASVVRQAEISMQLHLAVTLAVVLVVGTVAISGIRNAPARALSYHAKAPLLALPTLGMLPLCMIGIAAFLVEGAGIDWSAIYMRDVFAVEPFLGGLGLTLFTFFMAMAPPLHRSDRRSFWRTGGRHGPAGAVGHGPCCGLACAASVCRAVRVRVDGGGVQRRLSAGGLGGCAAYRSARADECRRPRAGNLHRLLPRPAAPRLRRRACGYADLLPDLPAARRLCAVFGEGVGAAPRQ
jgi:MFS family permease